MSNRLRSLEALAREKVTENLGKLAEGTATEFSCCGSLISTEKVKVLCKTKSGEWSAVEVPGATDEQLQQLIDTCSSACPGSDGQQDAKGPTFVSTFQLSNTPILGEITATMVPELYQVRAELCELNVYAKGGHFKAHVDTPKPNQLFGSLVVCLPTQFTGGQLVTRSHIHEVVFDWSSSPLAPKTDTSWAAFLAHAKREVLPVTSGYCVTFTYNLYQNPWTPANVQAASDVSEGPLFAELRRALANPTFLSNGGVLGFSSHHAYIFEELKQRDGKDRLVLLKGADRIVYLTAKALGLSVIVKPVVNGSCYSGLFDNGYVASEFPEFVVRGNAGESESEFEAMSDTFRVPLHCDKYITWCQQPAEWQPAGVTVSYGNESRSVSVFYQAAVILVGVPHWNDFRKSFVASSGAAKKKSKKKKARRAERSRATKKARCSSEEPNPKRGCEETSSMVLQRLCFHGEVPSYDSDNDPWDYGLDSPW